MKRIYAVLSSVVTVIAMLVFIAGIAVTLLGIYEIFIAFTYVDADRHHKATLIAISLLKAVDMFLMAMVFFVFSLGVMILFAHPDNNMALKIPQWLRIKNFIELKVILWEAILTTLVVSYLVGVAEAKMEGEKISLNYMILPGVIFLISLSLYFLKKKGGEEH